jgi:hypothetical protein
MLEDATSESYDLINERFLDVLGLQFAFTMKRTPSFILSGYKFVLVLTFRF